jgi:hypothetical protein
MKLFLLASMASCAAASFMKPNFSHLLEKGRRLQTEESFEHDDDDGPNCNGPEDCNQDGDDDFCAIPEKSSSYNLRRRLFADFKGYGKSKHWGRRRKEGRMRAPRPPVRPHWGRRRKEGRMRAPRPPLN